MLGIAPPECRQNGKAEGGNDSPAKFI